MIERRQQQTEIFSILLRDPTPETEAAALDEMQRTIEESRAVNFFILRTDLHGATADLLPYKDEGLVIRRVRQEVKEGDYCPTTDTIATKEQAFKITRFDVCVLKL